MGRRWSPAVDPGSPAEKAGVKPGWEVLSVDGKDLAPAIQKLKADPAIHELTLERAVAGAAERTRRAARLSVAFLDGANRGIPR